MIPISFFTNKKCHLIASVLNGRSTFLQSLGQLFFLHQIGSYLPVTESDGLPLFDHFCSKIYLKEDPNLELSLHWVEMESLSRIVDAV